MRVAALIAVAGALFTAPVAAGAIPQRGIAGVELGMTPAEVLAVLGPPDRYVTVQNDAIITYRRWIYSWHKLRVGVIGITGGKRRVLNVTTRSPEEQTGRRARVGITEASLLTRHSGVTCTNYHRVRTFPRKSGQTADGLRDSRRASGENLRGRRVRVT